MSGEEFKEIVCLYVYISLLMFFIQILKQISINSAIVYTQPHFLHVKWHFFFESLKQ